uniref:hypothetical protein n=1 Tax=Aliarcobacter sp. TaxID=2321116 RepID=UPI0040477B83
MEYLRELFYTLAIFFIAYLLLKNNIFRLLSESKTIDKKFKSCFILKYPDYAEFHNKNTIYQIDLENFFQINPSLKNKIKVIERPAFDRKDISAIKKELEERKKIIAETIKK